LYSGTTGAGAAASATAAVTSIDRYNVALSYA
jgi:hypothetical protein